MQHSILIVEDEPLIRDLIKTYLEPVGCLMTEAGDLAEARKTFAGAAPDVVLLDLRLPDGSGLSLLPEIKSQWPGTRVVILTGDGTIETAEAAYKQGDVFLLNKPFDAEMLRTVLELSLTAGGKGK
jgi:two-component system, NtrC family, response regulator AtoC